MCFKMTNFMKFIQKVIWILFGIIIAYLFISSLLSTSYIGELEYFIDQEFIMTEINTEHTFFVRDPFWPHVLVFFLFSLIIWIWGKECDNSKRNGSINGKRVSVVLCILVGIISAAIVLIADSYPKFDQRNVIEIAAAFNSGDYTALSPGEYVFSNPHQIGIVLYFQILSFLFGELNYIAFGLVNSLWIALTYYCIIKIGVIVLPNIVEWKLSVLCFLFVPYMFYATFLYGTVPGLCLALYSIYFLLKYQWIKKKGVYLLLSSFFMGLAIIIKSNYIIFFIAEVLYLLVCGIQKLLVLKKLKGSVVELRCILLLSLVVFLSDISMDMYLTQLNNGVEISGVPMSAYIAMGIQDGKAAPGWYNGYNHTVFQNNNYEYADADKEAKEKIVEIFASYPQNISSTLSFYVKKIQSQWNNPTFQSLWIQDDRLGVNGLEWIVSGCWGRLIYTIFTNLLQSIILCGTLFFVIFGYRKEDWSRLLLSVVFIGGFLFHIVWEAKTIYVIPFFLLLLPMCISGYESWKKWLLHQKQLITQSGWKSSVGIRFQKMLMLVIVGLFLLFFLSRFEYFTKIFARQDDTGIFNVFTQEMIIQSVISR